MEHAVEDEGPVEREAPGIVGGVKEETMGRGDRERIIEGGEGGSRVRGGYLGGRAKGAATEGQCEVNVGARSRGTS